MKNRADKITRGSGLFRSLHIIIMYNFKEFLVRFPLIPNW